MDIFDKARDLVGDAVEQGRERADGLRQRRERSRLIKELGEAAYGQAKGEVDASIEVELLVKALDELEVAAAGDVLDLTDAAGHAKSAATDSANKS